MATRYTVTADLRAIVGDAVDLANVTAVVKTTLPRDAVVADASGALWLGDGRAPIVNGVATLDLLDPTDPDLNASWQYWLVVTTIPAEATVNRTLPRMQVHEVGPFVPDHSGPITDWADQFDTPAVSPEWRSGFRDEMEDLRDQSAANLAAQTDLSQIDTPDALVGTLIETPGSDTATALNAAYGRLEYTVTTDATIEAAGAHLTLVGTPSASRTLTLPDGTYQVRITNHTDHAHTLIRSGASSGVSLTPDHTIDIRA